MARSSQNPLITALQWHIDAGADEAIQDTPNDRTKAVKEFLTPTPPLAPPQAGGKFERTQTGRDNLPPFTGGLRGGNVSPETANDLIGTAQARLEAAKLAKSCQTLSELRDAIAGFDALAIRKTATNMVFADGNPKASIMLIGEAPGADEDRQGLPFVGVSGQLLDKMFKAIGLARGEEDPAKSVYISNILNWRPPGNRTPSPSEIDISLPFIERHIALVNPKIIILCGGVAAKGLLGSGESISKLRGRFHDYRPITEAITDNVSPIPALATYHPSYLLRTPSQKRLAWADLLMLQERMEQISR